MGSVTDEREAGKGLYRRIERGRCEWSGGQGLVGKNRKSRTCTNKEWKEVLHDIDTRLRLE